MERTKREKDILSKFKKAREKRQLKDARWNELDKFDRGEQWDDSNLPPWVPKPVTNYVHLVKSTKRAAFAIENPVGKLRALTIQDEMRISRLQKVYEYEWQRMKARKYVRSALETGKLLGTSIVQIYWDASVISGGTNGLYEGVIKMKEIDVASFYPDPTAFTLEDCQFIHIVERKSVEWLKKHPLFKEKMKEVEARKVADNERGEIYNRNSVSSDTDGMIDFRSHFEKKPNKDGGFTYSVTYLAGDKEVHHIEQIRPNCYPFAVYLDYPQRQDFWGKSTCELVIENQKIVNKVEAIITLIGTQLQNPQRIVSRQSGINPREVARYGSAPGHVFVTNGNPNTAMTWATPPQIPTALFNLRDSAALNIREITGITQSYMGENVGSLQTSSGVNQLIERATMRDRDQMFDLELFIEELSRLTIRFIAEYYTEERFARYSEGPGEEFAYLSYVGSEFEDVEFDFFIDVSAQAPVTRQRMMEEADKLLTIQGQYGQMFDVSLITPEDVVSMHNFVEKDKMLARMKQERVVNHTTIAFEVSQMMAEALQNGLDPQEVQQMGQEMLNQRYEEMKQGIGSANASQIQNQQAGIS